MRLVVKIMADKAFEETCKPVYDMVRQMGLTEKDVEALIDEARIKSGSSKRK